MDKKKIGHTIKNLRIRANLTQAEVAERLGISDKAVSKWERGISYPDISNIQRLATILDIDSDSVLQGLYSASNSWKGMLILDEEFSVRTVVYNKPIIYLFLSHFLLVGIYDIDIYCSPEDAEYLESLLEIWKETKVCFHIRTIGKLDFPKGQNVMMVMGNAFLFGVNQTALYQKCMAIHDRMTMLVKDESINTSGIGVMANRKGCVVEACNQTPKDDYLEYRNLGILFIPQLYASMLQTEDKASIIASLTRKGDMYVEYINRSYMYLNVDSWEKVGDLSVILSWITKLCGFDAFCLEEISYKRGLITEEQAETIRNRRGCRKICKLSV